MIDKAISCEIFLDFAQADSISSDQKWVLSAMQKHGQQLIMLLWRILGNEQDVCDAYQETFLQLAHFEGGRKKPKYLKAYIFSTANNVAISMLRRRIAERKRNSDTTEHVRNTVNSPITELDSRYLRQSLRDCIARLPDHLREVIVLHDFAELPYKKISKILGITIGTARVYRCKAIQLLAVWMGKEEQL